jgi:hypothetical protein
MFRTGRLRDVTVGFALFVAMVGVSLVYLRGTPLGHFYQEEFAPAVAFACVRKYAVPEMSSALLDFLHARTSGFNCSDLPALAGRPFDIWQRQHLYLILLTGIIWSITGVSWDAVALVSALAAGGFVVAVYSVGRLFVPSGWAAAIALAAALSPYHLRMLPEVRDYAKGAFIVGAVWFGCRLATPAATAKRSLLLGGGAGVVTGIGFGFRSELATAIPFLLMALVLVLIGTKLRAWRHVAAAAGAFAVSLAIVAAPLFGAYRTGGVLGFAALNGLTAPFSAELGLSQPLYDIGDLFSDNYIGALVHGYAAKFASSGAWPDYMDQYPHYGGYSVRAFLEYARHFPADMVVRAYASILKVLSPHTRDVALTPLNPGLLLTLVALALIAADAPVLSLTLALAVVYFSGLGALQFHSRHLFHLEFFAWLTAAIVAAAAVRRDRREFSLARLKAGAWVPLAGMFGAALLLLGLRVYQQHDATALFSRYVGSQRQPLALQERQQGDAVLLYPSGPVPDMAGGYGNSSEPVRRGYYFAAVLDERRCPKRMLSLRIAYTGSADDFSRDLVVVTADGGDTHVFFPVFTDGGHQFAGVAMSGEDRRCLAGLEAVIDYKSLPLPLWLRLPSNWPDQRLYQTIVW